jgi:hypothetical protein
MNDMDEPTFKRPVESLVRHSAKSPFMLTVFKHSCYRSDLYFYFYGFGNRWIAAGLALWLVAGVMSKIIKLPIYQTVAALKAAM